MARAEKFDRKGSIELVPLAKMQIPSRHAQREKLNRARVDYIHSRFDPDKLGHPVLSKRADAYYIIDGQHRVEAVKQFLGALWESQVLECFVYNDLTEAEEAELFLSLNDVLSVNAFDKFRVAANAGRSDEVEINRVVTAAGLCISREQVPGAVRAVTTLRRLYARSDAKTLARTLMIIRESYGDAGFEARVIDGIGYLCQRYGNAFTGNQACEALGSARGGVNGLLNKADVLHKQTGAGKAVCVAAAAVEIINSRAPRGKKLTSWWNASDAEEQGEAKPAAVKPRTNSVLRGADANRV